MNLFRLSRILVLASALALAACGFEMRGTADLSFDTLHMRGANLSVNKDLKKSLKVNGVTVVEDETKADLLVEMMSEQREQNILSLSGAGVVREFELVYRVNFRMRNPASETWGEVQTVEGRRDFAYDDAQLLAKQFEEQRLFEDMRIDAVREIMRRLVVQKPKGNL
ncbi:LPS-assembly lipoprotein LptE [Methylophilaceae bacterium]|nr:LPS-assembly lipoprotein LptE [Methylophilaceae bacterium]